MCCYGSRFFFLFLLCSLPLFWLRARVLNSNNNKSSNKAIQKKSTRTSHTYLNEKIYISKKYTAVATEYVYRKKQRVAALLK